VANGRAWQNEVGPENAALLRESLARHLAASRPDGESDVFGEKYPLLIWLQEAAEAAAAGGDLNALLAEAQGHGQQYLACLAGQRQPGRRRHSLRQPGRSTIFRPVAAKIGPIFTDWSNLTPKTAVSCYNPPL
jgi:hypothetical protein